MPGNVFPITPLLHGSSTTEIRLQRFYGEQRQADFSAPGYLNLVPPISFIKNIQNEPI